MLNLKSFKVELVMEKRDYVSDQINVDQKDNNESFSFQRYLINIFVRFVFFMFPVPITKIAKILYEKQLISADFLVSGNLYLPLGLSIAVIGLIVGGK